MRPDPDQALLDRWRAGSAEDRRAAFDELYRRYHRKVYGTARHVTGDSVAAADVTQETFLQVFEKFDMFESRSSFSSWLYRIAVNCAGEYRRKHRKNPMPLPGSSTAPRDGAGTPEPERDRRRTDATDGTEEMTGEVQEALLQLSPKLRTVVVLRYIESLSYEEVAEVLGCSVGTVKSRLNRAHEALEQWLAPRRDAANDASAQGT